MSYHGMKNSIVTSTLIPDCDPFWISAQAMTRTHVRQYVQRQGLDTREHRRLLDILGLGKGR